MPTTTLHQTGTPGVERNFDDKPAADVPIYWVGGSGNWSDPNSWSDSSGGTPGNTGIPDDSRAVIFDAASGAGSYTATIDIDAAMESFDARTASENLTINLGGNNIQCDTNWLMRTWNGTSNNQTIIHSNPDSYWTVGGSLTTNYLQATDTDSTSLRLNGSGEWNYVCNDTNTPLFRHLNVAYPGENIALRCQNTSAGRDIDVYASVILNGGELSVNKSEVDGETRIETHNRFNTAMNYQGTGTLQLEGMRFDCENANGLPYALMFNTDRINVEALGFLDITGGNSANKTWMATGELQMPSTMFIPEKFVTYNFNGFDHTFDIINSSSLGDVSFICGNDCLITCIQHWRLNSQNLCKLDINEAICQATYLQINSPAEISGSVGGRFTCGAGTIGGGAPIYVASAANGGDDANDGLSPGSPKETFAHAIQFLASGVPVLFNKGDSFPIAPGTQVTATAGEIGAYGAGAFPQFQLAHADVLQFTAASAIFWREGVLNIFPTDVNVEANFTLTRDSGAAPLAVCFDAHELNGCRAANTTVAYDYQNAFHELRYQWDFDDPGASFDNRPGLDANTAEGPIVSHVFENPGTYDVTLTVYDPQGNSNQITKTVTVDNPAWRAIFCDSSATGGNNGTTPADAYTSLDTALADLFGSPGPTRLEVARDQVYTPTGQTYQTQSDWGPYLITTYGTGAKPIWSRPTGNALRVRNIWDVRIVDQDLRGSPGNTDNGIVFETLTNGFEILTLRCNIFDFRNLYETTGSGMGARDAKHSFLVDCTLDTARNYGIRWNFGYHCGFLANRISNCGIIDEHNFRCSLSRCCQMYNEQINATDGNTILKFRGWDTQNHGRPAWKNDYNNIRENEYRTEPGDLAAILCQIGPHDDNNSNQLVDDNLFDSNKIIARGDPTQSTQLLSLNSDNITARNNVIVSDASDRTANCIYVVTRGDNPAPRSCDVYGNSIYVQRGQADDEMRGVRADDGSGHRVRDNIVGFADAVLGTKIAFLDSTAGSAWTTNARLNDDSEVATAWVDAPNVNMNLVPLARGRVGGLPDENTPVATLLDSGTSVNGLHLDHELQERNLVTPDIGSHESDEVTTERYWLGVSTLWSDPANWAAQSGGTGGAPVPTLADNVFFDGAGLGNCTLDIPANTARWEIDPAYTGTINFAGAPGLTHTVINGFDASAASGVTLTMGDATLDVTGDYLVAGVTGFNRDTSTLILRGTGNSDWGLIPAPQNLEVQGVRTMLGAVGHLVYGTANIFGSLSGAPGIVFESATADLQIEATGDVSNIPLEFGLDGVFSRNDGTCAGCDLTWRNETNDFVLPAVDNLASLDLQGKLAGQGVINFVAPVSLEILGNFNLQSDNIAGTTLTYNSATNNTQTQIHGDVTIVATGSGAVGWAKGTNIVAIVGSASQSLDFFDLAIETLLFSKQAGTATMQGGVTCDSFTGSGTGSGFFDPNGQTIATVGVCNWSAGFVFVADADAMNGSIWDVGGDFNANSNTLNATAPWFLNVQGAASALGTGSVAFSDASGGSEVQAWSGPWTDLGNNVNWNFTPTADISLLDFERGMSRGFTRGFARALG